MSQTLVLKLLSQTLVLKRTLYNFEAIYQIAGNFFYLQWSLLIYVQ